MTAAAGFNEDFLDILRALVDSEAEFIVVGAQALALHGVPEQPAPWTFWSGPRRKTRRG